MSLSHSLHSRVIVHEYFSCLKFLGGHLANPLLCRPSFRETKGKISYLEPEEILKMKCSFLLIMVVVFAFSEALPLTSRALSGKNLRLKFPKPLSIFGLAKQIFCHLSHNIGFPDILGRRK